jgi:uncharacterized protein
MSRMFLTLAALIGLAIAPVAPARAADPKLEGDWQGSLKVTDAISLRLVYHITKAADGSYSATMDSPDQGAKGLKVDSVKYMNGTATLTSKGIGAEYVGKPTADGKSIKGTFTQGGKGFPLDLTPAVALGKPDMIFEGTLKANAGIELRIVLNVFKQKDGTFTATMDSPDQGVAGLKVDSVSLSKDKLAFEVKLIKGEYSGKLNGAGTEAVGQWKQGGGEMSLTLKKTDKVSELKRTQVPKAPFPYNAVEVAYDNKESGNTLAGTLTLPKEDGPHTAVILITGSGAQDRDETLLGHKPFLVLADYLTRRGVAVLRVDDRGVGGSTGDPAKATSADFATDVKAGVDFLKTRKEIDPKRIGLMGHSEGGMIAPMVAAKYPDDVAFLVLLAGTGVPGDEILAEQLGLIQKAMGRDSAAVEKSVVTAKKMYAILRDQKDDAAAKTAIEAMMKETIATLSEAERKELGDNPSAAMDAQLKMLQSPWFRYFLTYDPRPTLAKVKCPVLAINGEKDLQVPPGQNLPEIAKALKAGGNSAITTRELPNLNHLFQTSKTGAPTEYAQIEETFAPAALEVVGDWITKLK